MSDKPSKEALEAVKLHAIKHWGGAGGETVVNLAALLDAFASERVAAANALNAKYCSSVDCPMHPPKCSACDEPGHTSAQCEPEGT